jgi:hypothetical protein
LNALRRYLLMRLVMIILGADGILLRCGTGIAIARVLPLVQR